MNKPKLQLFPSLKRTRTALAWYDKRAPMRAKLSDAVQDRESYNKWEIIESDHKKVVGTAFFLDTSDRNSRENAMLVDIDTLREWVKKWEKQEREKS